MQIPTERQVFCMKHDSAPTPEDFWVRLSPSQLDDPAFRAAAMGTIYEPLPSDSTVVPDDPTDDDPPIPPEVWPGL